MKKLISSRPAITTVGILWRGATATNHPAAATHRGLRYPFLGVSITGGYVYRGSALSSLSGLYIYAGFGTGRIWALDNSDPENPQNEELINTDLSISSFGVDANNELYICSFDGSIYQLEEMPAE